MPFDERVPNGISAKHEILPASLIMTLFIVKILLTDVRLFWVPMTSESIRNLDPFVRRSPLMYHFINGAGLDSNVH